jgi:hypothetical protein
MTLCKSQRRLGGVLLNVSKAKRGLPEERTNEEARQEHAK